MDKKISVFFENLNQTKLFTDSNSNNIHDSKQLQSFTIEQDWFFKFIKLFAPYYGPTFLLTRNFTSWNPGRPFVFWDKGLPITLGALYDNYCHFYEVTTSKKYPGSVADFFVSILCCTILPNCCFEMAFHYRGQLESTFAFNLKSKAPISANFSPFDFVYACMNLVIWVPKESLLTNWNDDPIISKRMDILREKQDEIILVFEIKEKQLELPILMEE